MKPQYDDLIKQASKQYLPGYDWRLLKSQFFQESSFNPLARSPAGALGFAQIMPATWARFGDGDPLDARDSINAGARVMADMIGQWSWPRPDIDRTCLALASYNAGLGHILKAQKLSGNASGYAEIIAHLPAVTGDNHSAETIEYVRKILGYWVAEVTRK